ncbi:MAG: sigma-70 family RNA polymerase sigma factor [Leptospiraceae bacterium]|nr:sigma-70 family RNA polymerase sigma factor [Leptospiraceae bacterium]MCK6381550.1 sigma-70 family RNA polymerase sigma factor [Leptospiraceae bacterium]NUM41374.1 sigma-70 family RNA polymerase sigma factor [Leptospiraceae bacterium]
MDVTLKLIQSCAEGNSESLKFFFEEYSEDIYNFPIKVFRLSEDEAGDFFLYAYERLKEGKKFQSFKGKSSFKTWFYSVLRNMLIDWKRSKRELKVHSINRINSEGEEYSLIENEPDNKFLEKENAYFVTDEFYKALSQIKIENRVIFKLSFIYYLYLEDDEIDYILNKTRKTKESLSQEILKIREILSDKEKENILSEEKITSLYTSIQRLKEIQNKEGKINFQDNLEYKDKIESAISKKYEQIQKLLTKKQKGNLIARTPHKLVSEILEISEGNVSVALIRVIEILQKNLLAYV